MLRVGREEFEACMRECVHVCVCACVCVCVCGLLLAATGQEEGNGKGRQNMPQISSKRPSSCSC